jgi:hypothetical protein
MKGDGSAFLGGENSIHLGIIADIAGCRHGTTSEIRASQCRFVDGSADSELVITAKGCHRFSICGRVKNERVLTFAKVRILREELPKFGAGPQNPFPNQVRRLSAMMMCQRNLTRFPHALLISHFSSKLSIDISLQFLWVSCGEGLEAVLFNSSPRGADNSHSERFDILMQEYSY